MPKPRCSTDSLENPLFRSHRCYRRLKNCNCYSLPLAPKTDLFKKLYMETIIRNPKKVSFSGHTLNSKPFSICFPLNYRGKIVARVSLWSGERALWIQLTNFTGRAWGFLIIGILDAAPPGLAQIIEATLGFRV